MTFEKWQAAFRPKALGSWNLHCCLPDDMDFFILLSSASGILGNPGQANYAAGNTFQDALAEYRQFQQQTNLASGQKDRHNISLDLGLVLEAGLVAEDERLLDIMLAHGFIGVRLADVQYLLERAMARPVEAATERPLWLPAQVVTAMGTGGLSLQNGTSSPHMTNSALFEYLNLVDLPVDQLAMAPRAAARRGGKKGGKELQAEILAAKSHEDAENMAVTGVARKLGYILGMGAGTGTGANGTRHTRGDSSGSDISSSGDGNTNTDGGRGRKRSSTSTGLAATVLDVTRSTRDYGVDSLVKLSITRWIVDQTGVAVGDIDSFESIRELGSYISRHVRSTAD